jgi:hypothetical protein
MNERDVLIWKYLDGQATAEEKVRVERLLKEDQSFKAAFLERRQLENKMQEEDLEQPSLRFAKNIMDKLPDLYRRTVEPLVRPFWIRFFFGSLALFLLAYFGMVAYTLPTGEGPAGGPVARITEQVSAFFEGLPTQVLTIVSALCFAYLGLVWLDRQLKKWIFSRHKRAS